MNRLMMPKQCSCLVDFSGCHNPWLAFLAGAELLFIGGMSVLIIITVDLFIACFYKKPQMH